MRKNLLKINLLVLVGWFIAMVFFTGCQSTPTPGYQIPEIDQVVGASNRVALCVGWTSVDPFWYQGWEGDCPGCDWDTKGFFDLFSQNGFTAKMMMNGSATWSVVRSETLRLGKKLHSGDLLVLVYSGHGGQKDDVSGDEPSGKDSTLCMWDGEVVDDEILKMLQELPIGVRVVMINDQCHSEGNFKTIWNATKKIATLGLSKRKPVQALIRTKHSTSNLKTVKVVSVWNGPLIQFAGCREASYSYGGSSGGSWSQDLLLVQDTMSNLTWRSWFDQGRALMDTAQQDPQWVEYGDVRDYFRNGPALK